MNFSTRRLSTLASLLAIPIAEAVTVFAVVSITSSLTACQQNQLLGNTSDAAVKSDAPGKDGLSMPVDSVDCMTVCEATAENCGEPASGAAVNCAAACPKTLTEAEAACLRSSPCSDLAAAFAANGTVCGISPPDAAVTEAATPNCVETCTTKAVSCSISASNAALYCAPLCKQSPTTNQLDCLQTSTCEQLSSSGESGNVCGLAVGDSGAPSCGDGVCDFQETCSSCPTDCGACPDHALDASVTGGCGDGLCEGGETCETCAQDCGGCPKGDAG